MSGSGISWAICKSAPRSRQITMSATQPRQHPTTQFFTGRMPFLRPNQQHQSTEGEYVLEPTLFIMMWCLLLLYVSLRNVTTLWKLSLQWRFVIWALRSMCPAKCWPLMCFEQLSRKAAYWNDFLYIESCCLQCFDTVGWAAGRASGL